MKKKYLKILSVILAFAVMLCAFTACSGQSGNGGNQDSSGGSAQNQQGGQNGQSGQNGGDNVKIGVLVADVSGEEALGFRNYYENYIAKNYNVRLLYTEQLQDAASEKSAIEKFASQGCKAIISISGSDRALQIETCENNKLYYAVAAGTMDKEQFESYKDSEYFVGQIGPDLETEYKAGYEMGKYFADKDVKNVAIYGGFIPNPMHVYRAAGILAGLGATYGGSDDMEGMVGQIFGDQSLSVKKIKSDKIKVVSYFQGYGDTTTDELNAAIQAKPDLFLSVGMATTFFAQQLNTAKIDFADIDAFTKSNGNLMKDGRLVYLAGKNISSIGPIFAAVMNAVNGNLIRDNDGNALSISQDYLVATSADEFDKFYQADNGDTPIYNKELLDTVIGDNVSYDDFKSFVEADRT